MSDAFYLSDDEVVVLLGLCHGTVAYGIESKLFSHWQRQDQQMVKDLMNRLQSRDLISLDYHGVVHIKKGLYDLLQVMKAPTELLSLKTVLFSGEKETYFYYKKDGMLYEMKRGEFLHRFQEVQTIPLFEGETMQLHELLTKEDIDYVNESIDNFDEWEAMDYLESHTSSPTLVMDIIEKKYDETVVEYFAWKDAKLFHQKQITVGKMNQELFECVTTDRGLEFQGGASLANHIIQTMIKGGML